MPTSRQRESFPIPQQVVLAKPFGLTMIFCFWAYQNLNHSTYLVSQSFRYYGSSKPRLRLSQVSLLLQLVRMPSTLFCFAYAYPIPFEISFRGSMFQAAPLP